MIKRIPAHVVIEADTGTKTLALIVETVAADGEGDVELYRLDISAFIAGQKNADKRRKLRALFTASE